MAKKHGGPRHHQSQAASNNNKSPLDEARDELFQHIMKCGVIGSAPEDQAEWFDATMAYFTERFPELSKLELVQLRTLGERFAKPMKTTKQAV